MYLFVQNIDRYNTYEILDCDYVFFLFNKLKSLKSLLSIHLITIDSFFLLISKFPFK